MAEHAENTEAPAEKTRGRGRPRGSLDKAPRKRTIIREEPVTPIESEPAELAEPEQAPITPVEPTPPKPKAKAQRIKWATDKAAELLKEYGVADKTGKWIADRIEAQLGLMNGEKVQESAQLPITTPDPKVEPKVIVEDAEKKG